jgi:hypothetical protein
MGGLQGAEFGSELAGFGIELDQALVGRVASVTVKILVVVWAVFSTVACASARASCADKALAFARSSSASACINAIRA